MSRVSRFSRPKRTVLPYGSRLDVIFWHSYAIGSRQFLVMLGSAMDVADASRSGANLQGSYTDPCRIRSSSSARLALMATLFISMIVGGVPLFFVLAKRPYGFQTASAIVYTLYVVFFTFARTGTKGGKDWPPYMFTCPIVQSQFSRLLWRHLGFLAALFALQTLALAMRSRLPDWWNIGSGRNGSGMPPFEGGLLLLCVGLASAQLVTNRSLLSRAHQEVDSGPVGCTSTMYASRP